MKATLSSLAAARAFRPAGYVEAILAAGQYDPDGVHHHIAPAALAAIRTQYGITDPPLPALATMAATALAALGRTLGQALTGAPRTVGLAVAAHRRATCLDCEHLTSLERCAQCGCHMSGLWGKWTLAAERCPLRRW